tara:strand:+ start:13912 stop:14229 length:318 start_codon:yes stop_codon:yes gene_type:complete
MAVFKNAIKTNVTTVQTLYSTPASKTSILIELDVANTTTASQTVDVQVVDNSASATGYLVKGAPVPAGSALQVVAGQKIVLEAQDSIKIIATGAVDVIGSLLEDV